MVASDRAARPARASIGVVGVGRIAGEVIATARHPGARQGGDASSASSAALNLFLFLFNLIPLLPLDGGHVAGALWEGLKRWFARLRSRPDPGPVDVAKAAAGRRTSSSSLLIVMSVVLLYADIVKPDHPAVSSSVLTASVKFCSSLRVLTEAVDCPSGGCAVRGPAGAARMMGA